MFEERFITRTYRRWWKLNCERRDAVVCAHDLAQLRGLQVQRLAEVHRQRGGVGVGDEQLVLGAAQRVLHAVVAQELVSRLRALVSLDEAQQVRGDDDALLLLCTICMSCPALQLLQAAVEDEQLVQQRETREIAVRRAALHRLAVPLRLEGLVRHTLLRLHSPGAAAESTA